MTLTQRLQFRRRCLAAADAELAAAQHRLAAARKANTHPRQQLVADVDRLQARVKKWCKLIDATTHAIAAVNGATRPSLAVAEMIARFEGGESPDGLFHVYWDADGGVYTQGFGRTGQSVTKNSPPVSRATAVRWLREDLNGAYADAVRAVCHELGLRLSQKQFDGLLSPSYNAGTGQLDKHHKIGAALRTSRANRQAWRARVGDAIRTTALTGAATHEILPGLVRRRAGESTLWMGGPYA